MPHPSLSSVVFHRKTVHYSHSPASQCFGCPEKHFGFGLGAWECHCACILYCGIVRLVHQHEGRSQLAVWRCWPVFYICSDSHNHIVLYPTIWLNIQDHHCIELYLCSVRWNVLVMVVSASKHLLSHVAPDSLPLVTPQICPQHRKYSLPISSCRLKKRSWRVEIDFQPTWPT